MLIALLIILLSEPGEPAVFGVMQEFKTPAECIQAVRNADIPDSMKRRLSCIEIKKQREA